MTYRAEERLAERAAANYDAEERKAFEAAYSHGYFDHGWNCSPENFADRWPNAYGAGYWEGQHDGGHNVSAAYSMADYITNESVEIAEKDPSPAYTLGRGVLLIGDGLNPEEFRRLGELYDLEISTVAGMDFGRAEIAVLSLSDYHGEIPGPAGLRILDEIHSLKVEPREPRRTWERPAPNRRRFKRSQRRK